MRTKFPNHKILGRNWTDIQKAQQGAPLDRNVEFKEKPKATEDDLKLLEKHGLKGLEQMKFYGVIDRLKTSGMV